MTDMQWEGTADFAQHLVINEVMTKVNGCCLFYNSERLRDLLKWREKP